MRYAVAFPELSPHTVGNNGELAKEKCLKICSKYRWCYAVFLTLLPTRSDPLCSLVTDRPTFENFYGQDQDYSNNYKILIDGIEYRTLCGNGCSKEDDKGSNWDGGKLHPSVDVFCYKKSNIGTGII